MCLNISTLVSNEEARGFEFPLVALQRSGPSKHKRLRAYKVPANRVTILYVVNARGTIRAVIFFALGPWRQK